MNRNIPMTPKIIKTEQEYRKALAHVESLMDAEPGTSRESELELWSLLVERYEETHFPIGSPDPVDAIKFRMEQEGLQAERPGEVFSKQEPCFRSAESQEAT